MNKKILLLTLLIVNTIKPTTLEIITGRRELAQTVLSTNYKDLNQTVNDIERVEDALERSRTERKTKIDKRLKLSLKEAIRFLESARKRLDIIEEKQNPAYYDKPAVYVSKDFSYDTLIKNRQDEVQPEAHSRTVRASTINYSKLLMFIFIISLLINQRVQLSYIK